MYLKRINILNFKNIEDKSFDFSRKINCFVGLNGVGKTNLLDAIYYLAHGKSYFNPIAVQNIQHNSEFFVLDAFFQVDNKEEHVVCSLKKGQKKILKRNGKAYTRLADHFGLIPVVIISPSDSNLIVEGSETRRRFLDSVISQLNPTYLQQLIQYQKLIVQRNALLKDFSVRQYYDLDTLEIYDEQIAFLAQPIFETRKLFLQEFIPVFNHYHQLITGNAEEVSLSYKSHLYEEDMLTLFQIHRAKDRALQYTSTGIHRDDLEFELGGFSLKKFGSQGQQKSFLIALKLAQFDFIKQKRDVAPILLFDDIFDKLDEQRVRKILELVTLETFGQMFISDTHADRTEHLLKSIGQEFELFEINKKESIE